MCVCVLCASMHARISLSFLLCVPCACVCLRVFAGCFFIWSILQVCVCVCRTTTGNSYELKAVSFILLSVKERRKTHTHKNATKAYVMLTQKPINGICVLSSFQYCPIGTYYTRIRFFPTRFLFLSPFLFCFRFISSTYAL